jgi:hypothetical protein
LWHACWQRGFEHKGIRLLDEWGRVDDAWDWEIYNGRAGRWNADTKLTVRVRTPALDRSGGQKSAKMGGRGPAEDGRGGTVQARSGDGNRRVGERTISKLAV